MSRDEALAQILSIANTLPLPEQRKALEDAWRVLTPPLPFEGDALARAEQAVKDAEASQLGNTALSSAVWQRAMTYVLLAGNFERELELVGELEAGEVGSIVTAFEQLDEAGANRIAELLGITALAAKVADLAARWGEPASKPAPKRKATGRIDNDPHG